MATFTKNNLSGSTNGRPILVDTTATAGTLIHTAVAGTTTGTWDEIWLYAMNNNTSDEIVTIEFGGVTSPDDLFVDTIGTKDGLILMVPGFILQNTLIVRAFSETADVVSISGFVNSITA